MGFRIAKGEKNPSIGLRVLFMDGHGHEVHVSILGVLVLLRSKCQVFGVSRKPCGLTPSGVAAPKGFENKNSLGYLYNSKEPQGTQKNTFPELN